MAFIIFFIIFSVCQARVDFIKEIQLNAGAYVPNLANDDVTCDILYWGSQLEKDVINGDTFNPGYALNKRDDDSIVDYKPRFPIEMSERKYYVLYQQVPFRGMLPRKLKLFVEMDQFRSSLEAS